MNLKLVQNEEKYFEFIRIMRTHPNNTDGFLEQVNITQEQQKKYMDKYKNNYWICLLESEPVGFVGEIDGDIRFAVKPEMKNKGIGKFMIDELLKITKNVYAKVLIGNISSQKVFEKCGFNLTKKDDKFLYYNL
jgi:RimJ/RimL family protein N-acetyltransferase